jgi:hypothetical protein
VCIGGSPAAGMRESPEDGEIVAPMKEKIKRFFRVTNIPIEASFVHLSGLSMLST